MNIRTIIVAFCGWLLLALPTSCLANDGSFYAQGGTLIPLRETQVRMDKEVLRLVRMDDYMDVHVDFEFYNPGPEKKLLVGFVTPPAGGDVTEEEMSHPQVRDFTVVVDGKDLPFKVARLDGTEFKVLSEKSYQGDDFVYYFDVVFKPGITRVQHHYAFRGGNSVDTEVDFAYRLTTGNMWAGGKIGDFQLEIDMGDRELFTVPWSLSADSSHAPWALFGAGQLSAKPRGAYAESYTQAVYTSRGTVGLHLKDFRPEADLWMAVYWPYMEVALWEAAGYNGSFARLSSFLPPYVMNPEDLSELSKEDLRLLRNIPYAQHGYVFKDAKLLKQFSKLIWWDPLPGLKQEDIVLSKEEQEYVATILAEEQRRKEGK